MGSAGFGSFDRRKDEDRIGPELKEQLEAVQKNPPNLASLLEKRYLAKVSLAEGLRDRMKAVSAEISPYSRTSRVSQKTVVSLLSFEHDVLDEDLLVAMLRLYRRDDAFWGFLHDSLPEAIDEIRGQEGLDAWASIRKKVEKWLYSLETHQSVPLETKEQEVAFLDHALGALGAVTAWSEEFRKEVGAVLRVSRDFMANKAAEIPYGDIVLEPSDPEAFKRLQGPEEDAA